MKDNKIYTEHENNKESISYKIPETIKHLQKNLKIITRGSTCSSFSAPFLFIKYITRKQENDIYEREKYLGSILNKFDWYPKLLYSNDINQILIFNYSGVPVNKNNKPDDLEEQFNKILEDMKSINIQHNDIKHGEILVDENNKIYLCDFGWGSINNEHGCGIGLWNKRKTGGYRDDATALKRLELI